MFSKNTVLCITQQLLQHRRGKHLLCNLAPFVGSALAEYFRDSGKHALVIYDDLSKHARAYRQTSLRQTSLLRRSGLATYNLHVYSRLLSRAAQMSNTMGGGSLTALPIMETLAGDVSAPVIDHMLSITDGQIFLEAELFHRGFRPAISLGLSLSRGVQSKAMAQVTSGLRLQLVQYREVAAFAQFVDLADLDAETQQLLTRGEKLTELLKQGIFTPLAEEEIIALLYAGAYGYLDHVSTADVKTFEATYLARLRETRHQILDAIKRNSRLDSKIEEALRQVIEDIVASLHRRRLLSQADGDAQRLTDGKVLV